MLDALPDPMFMPEAGRHIAVCSGVIRRLGLIGPEPSEHNAFPKSAESRSCILACLFWCHGLPTTQDRRTTVHLGAALRWRVLAKRRKILAKL